VRGDFIVEILSLKNKDVILKKRLTKAGK